MMDIGLMPSSTGRPGGSITGQHMSDYIIEGGLFFKTFKVLEKRKKFKLKWIDLMSLPRLYDPIIADPNKSDSTEPDLPAFMANNPDIEVIEESKLVQHEFSSNETSLSELLPDDFLIKPEPPRSTRQRYTCYGCNTKIYGKSNLNVRCEDCDMLFEES